MTWSKGYAEWVEGETAYLSIAFTWLLDHAYSRAIWHRALGRHVRAGGPALFLVSMQHELTGLDGVEVGGSYPGAVARHNPDATFFTRGCDVGCSNCIVPPMEGREYSMDWDAVPRPVLCDNNLSAIRPEWQDFIIRRYTEAGVLLRDANSGFEPRTFTPDVYARWKPLIDAGGGPWRFAYDDMAERREVLAVMRMLADVRPKRKRVYVLIGNEPYAECMQRIREVIEHGCEPHVQPVMKLNALTKEPWVRHDWTAQKLRDVARWANSWSWKKCDFEAWDPTRNNSRRPVYDAEQGLFDFSNLTEQPHGTANFAGA